MYFDSWQGLARVVLVGIPAYAVLVVLLRLSGNRTLAKMNAFDLVVTVALGSTLASVLTSSSVALAEGVLALALLIGLQFAIAWGAARSRRFETMVKSEPILLYHDGRFLEREMRRARVTRTEIVAAMRRAGLGDRDGAAAVVLETAGEMSVLRSGTGTPGASTLDAAWSAEPGAENLKGARAGSGERSTS